MGNSPEYALCDPLRATRMQAPDSRPSVEKSEVDVNDPNGSVAKLDESPIGEPAIDEKKLLRRIDFVLVPWLSFLYLLCYLDRSGIGNARVCDFRACLSHW